MKKYIFIMVFTLIILVNIHAEGDGILYAIKVKDKYGYIDKTGKIIIEPKFNYAYSFEHNVNVAGVKVNDKYGYIDKKGQFIIKPMYDFIYDFKNGYARVGIGKIVFDEFSPWDKTIDGKIGFIDKDGKVTCEPKYSKANDFYEGLAYVEDKDFKYFINESGNIEISLKYKIINVYNFSEGLAPIRFRINKSYVSFIDKKGNIVIETDYRWAWSFKEGLAEVYDRNGKCGYIDKTGKLIIDFKYNASGIEFIDDSGDLSKGFSEGLAGIMVGEGFNSSNFKHGFINHKGEIVIKPLFESAGYFSEGLAIVTIDNKTGYIDKTGKFIIKAIYNDGSPFKSGLAIISIGKKEGLIDKEGKIIIEPQFDRIDEIDTKTDLIKVWKVIKYIVKEFKGEKRSYPDEKFAYIDNNGNFIWKEEGFDKYYKPVVKTLRLRDLPSINGKYIRTLIKDEILEYIEKGNEDIINGTKGNWVKVRTEKGEIGWCFDGYLEEVKN